MIFLTFILTIALISIAGLFIVAAIFNRKIYLVDKGFIYSLVIFYILWWIGVALAIKLNFYHYDPRFLLNVWVGGIPLEDHIAGILIIVWIRGLFDLLERKMPPSQ